MNSQRTNTKIFHRVCWSVVALLILWYSPSFSNDSKNIPPIKYLYRLDERFADFKDNSSPEEVLLILSDAETVCRLVATFDIPEGGGHDFLIGRFVELLIEKDRWDVLYKVLEKHFYYPQSSYWILIHMSEGDMKLKDLRKSYNLEQRKADAMMREVIEILKKKKAKEEDKTS